MNIRVFCKNCGWNGQAIVGKSISKYSHKRGFLLKDYCCPECGQDIKRTRGTYDFNSEYAVLKKYKRG